MELEDFFVREKVHNQYLIVPHIPAIDQVVDHLTKLSQSCFCPLRDKLNVFHNLKFEGNC